MLSATALRAAIGAVWGQSAGWTEQASARLRKAGIEYAGMSALEVGESLSRLVLAYGGTATLEGAPEAYRRLSGLRTPDAGSDTPDLEGWLQQHLANAALQAVAPGLIAPTLPIHSIDLSRTSARARVFHLDGDGLRRFAFGGEPAGEPEIRASLGPTSIASLVTLVAEHDPLCSGLNRAAGRDGLASTLARLAAARGER